MKVKSILITQPASTDGRSPYDDLKEKFKVNVVFRPFVKVEGVTAKEFRRERVTLTDHTAIIFTSRVGVDHFFRLLNEMRLEVPQNMKYFCVSESVGLYLQKFIDYRKRKVFYPKVRERELFDILQRHKTEHYLFPRSNVPHNELLDFMKKANLKFKEVTIYRTTPEDLSDLRDVKFDIIAFFSPAAVQALFENFPDFQQNDTRISAFGSSTAQSLINSGLKVNIEAPTPEFPSLKMALEEYIKKANK